MSSASPTNSDVASGPFANPIVNHASAKNGATESEFIPKAPQSLREAGISEAEVEALLLKSLFTRGAGTGRELGEQIKLNGPLVRETLDHLRAEMLITYKSTTELGDFVFQLTESGAQRAKFLSFKNTYCGAAPVPLEAYSESVTAQSIRKQPIRLDRFQEALSDLFIEKVVLVELAQAVNAGRGLFLFGAPGNGKTTVAERLTASYSDHIWIPRAITVVGDVIRLFDTSVHEEVDPAESGIHLDRDEVDHRWVLIKRPTIVVGGELTLQHLDIGQKTGTTVLEAPVQLKSNGGTLVIDDFGRQRVSPTDILNRWIVPLDRARDYLTLPNGRQITVPFVQNLVLATNLEPKSLVDEAFFRRIPYKIEMKDPNEETFRKVFHAAALKQNLICSEKMVTYLLKRYYRPQVLPLRYCHPGDLLFHVGNICDLHQLPREVTERTIDVAVRSYFNGLHDVGAGTPS